jgi:polysaccharide biosynthesis/export protein
MSTPTFRKSGPLLFLAGVLLAAPLAAQDPAQDPVQEMADPQRLQVVGDTTPTQLGSGDISLRPGDMVRIQVWRQPEFSGEFFITETGFIGHPLYRSIHAIRRPVREVEDRVRIFLTQFESEPNFVMESFVQVAVGGQVRQPDVHLLRPGTSMIEAVAQAGGVTEQGRMDEVLLRRAGIEYRLNFTDSASQHRNIPIVSGDEIVVQRQRSVFREYVLPVISVAGSIASIYRAVDRR